MGHELSSPVMMATPQGPHLLSSRGTDVFACSCALQVRGVALVECVTGLCGSVCASVYSRAVGGGVRNESSMEGISRAPHKRIMVVVIGCREWGAAAVMRTAAAQLVRLTHTHTHTLTETDTRTYAGAFKCEASEAHVDGCSRQSKAHETRISGAMVSLCACMRHTLPHSSLALSSAVYLSATHTHAGYA